MNSIPLSNRTIWITGASSGIGKALASRLAGNGNHLILTARNEAALEAIRNDASGNCNITILPADLSNNECLPALKSALDELPNGLDTMILSAGNCEYVDVKAFSSAMVERMSAINFVGMARCIEAGLPSLRRSTKNPHIVGIGSAAAITGLPRAEAYGASKAAVNNFLESLGLDLAPEGIDVSIVVPGFVDTPLTRKNDFPMPFLMDEESAATRIIRGIEKRHIRISFPWQLISLLTAMRLVPESWRMILGKSMVRST
jgi:short-subunit dehydrogenase